MRPYDQALALAAACSLVLAGGLLSAYVHAPRPLTSVDVLVATRRSVDAAVAAAISKGGLMDAEAFVRDALAEALQRAGFAPEPVRLRRPNDLNPWAVFHFFVDVGGLSVRFELHGTADPLAALRLGTRVPIVADPHVPYATHGDPSVLAVCLSRQYFHAARDAPDFFARLENRTRDPYRAGFESLLADGTQIAVDHTFFETGRWGLTAEQALRYGQ